MTLSEKWNMENRNPRILLVDDNVAIHEDFKAILENQLDTKKETHIADLENSLFDQENRTRTEACISYHIDDAFQGEEAIKLVDLAKDENDPYSLIFMDVRMPPGIDGIKTIKKIWEQHPEIQMVVCTAFSDYSWIEILKTLGDHDNLLIIKKPFDAITIKQTALTLTKKWSLQRKTENYTHDLETNVRIRTETLEKVISDLERMKNQAEASAVAKGRFLSMMSHELRTPLNGIIGMAELLLRTQMDEEQNEYTETIISSGGTLLSLINQVLDYSRIEANKLELDNFEFNITTKVESIATLLATNILDKNIEFVSYIDPAIPETVIGDCERFGQIIVNLLGNAIKFTESGNIYLGLSLIEEQEHTIRLKVTISDSGIGISKSAQQKLFSPFTQSDTSITRKHGGSGLGLSIAQQLVGLMDGKIEIDSDIGKGSVFHFTVVFKKVVNDNNPKQLTPEGSEVLDAEPKQIVIIGDNSKNHKVIESYLSYWGCQVSICESAASLIESCKKHSISPSFIIVDCLKSTADQYTEISKALSKYDVPLIAVLKKRTQVLKTILKKYNYTHFISRPIKKHQLFESVIGVFDENKQNTNQPKGAMDKFLDLSGMHILVVDDNLVNQKILLKLISKLNATVDLASNGEEAIEAFSNRNYDAILMDIQMPVMNGIEATQYIRNTAKGKEVPIIATTADVMEKNRSACLNAGINDFIAKPFRLQEIVSSLEPYIHN